MLTYKTESAEETRRLGEELARLLEPGMVILLDGDLGAGKTALAGGILKGLGVDDYVTSPTFTLVNEYDTDFSIAHFDLYRLDDPDQLFDIGFDEYLDGQWLVLIEWPKRAGGYLPENYLKIGLVGQGESPRELTLQCIGEEYIGLNEELKNLVSIGN